MKVRVLSLKSLAKIAPRTPIPIKQVAHFNAVSEEPAILDSFQRKEDGIWAWTMSARGMAGLFEHVPPIDWS